MSKSVIVAGGGVAGMSAAHELAERGFRVRVFERQPSVPGGKARSVPVPGSATGGRRPLPGEHGFRFFPGFYRHLPDTMKRIPDGAGRTAFDHLVPTQKMMMARFGKPPVETLMHVPRSMAELEEQLHALFDAHFGLAPDDVAFFAGKVWQLLTSCHERRMEEYERLNWWDFLDADNRGEAYRTLFVNGLTRSLVAAKAKHMSVKTGGDIFLQLLFNMTNPAVTADRVLDGPTNDVWIDPWLAHLRGPLGVTYTFDAVATRFETDRRGVSAVWVSEGGRPPERHTADYYVSAVPVEQMNLLLDDTLLARDPTLGGLRTLATQVKWMNGLQFYLYEDVPICPGHVLYLDTPWALTSISQAQFWPAYPLAACGDGTARGVISVDISDWNTPGLEAPEARNCVSAEAIKDEVWRQLCKSLDGEGGSPHLYDGLVRTWHLDGDIVREGSETTNAEPLLVNNAGTWGLRPDAYTALPNLFLASDYVRTNTDLATMEGANEAARRAVNGVLSAAGSRAKTCEVWDLHDPNVLAPLRWMDQNRYDRGQPWRSAFPLPLRVAHRLFAEGQRLYARVAG
ncbi:MAG TPA: FAD-dependent oxidoreductase [Rhodothermales bacterium]|nr:FAD-dependent oxidoreductase [Rhodothermales bacterium]